MGEQKQPKKERNKNKKKVGISENQLNIIMDCSKEYSNKVIAISHLALGLCLSWGCYCCGETPKPRAAEGKGLFGLLYSQSESIEGCIPSQSPLRDAKAGRYSVMWEPGGRS